MRDCASFGLLPPPRPEVAEFGLWPGQEGAVLAFHAVATQWRVGPSGKATGLDYAAARAGLEAEGIAVTPDDWRGLRAIEAGALKGWE